VRHAFELGEESGVAAILTSVTKSEDIAELDIGASICSPPPLRSKLVAELDLDLPDL
jgi:hypothetical protein